MYNYYINTRRFYMSNFLKEFERQQLIDSDEEVTQDDLLNDDYYVDLINLSKKSKSRNRHSTNLKSKRKTLLSASFLSSDFKQLSKNATNETFSRLRSRQKMAEKKAARLK